MLYFNHIMTWTEHLLSLSRMFDSLNRLGCILVKSMTTLFQKTIGTSEKILKSKMLNIVFWRYLKRCFGSWKFEAGTLKMVPFETMFELLRTVWKARTLNGAAVSVWVKCGADLSLSNVQGPDVSSRDFFVLYTMLYFEIGTP